jgi:hypothetical protein
MTTFKLYKARDRSHLCPDQSSNKPQIKISRLLFLAALTAPRPCCLPNLISFLGLRFFLLGLSYQDLTEQCFQLLMHQLNAGFKLLEHGFADMQFFTVIEAPGPEQ